MSLKPIVILDDEKNALISLEAALNTMQYENVCACQNSENFWKVIEKRGAEVVLLDIIMPSQSGEEILQQLQEQHPDIPVIMTTSLNELETAVRCMRNGAFDYLNKPIEREELKVAIQRAIKVNDLKRSNEALASSLMGADLSHPQYFEEILTQNRNMIGIFKYVEAVASTHNSVLITGETGTGKELFAKAIHKASGRTGDFVPVNVAGLDDSMLSDTLFGHAKGAFTGAESNRVGLVEKAENGTLFLDEIGDLSIPSQVKLLRLLQENEFLPLGSEQVKYSNCRIVAATSQKIESLNDNSNFRRDLYYRLKMHHIKIPPLRDRKDDIPLLCNAFINEASKDLGKKTPHVPTEIEGLLSNYNFPGNIRELRSIIHDAIANHQGKIMSLSRIKATIGTQEMIESNDIESRDFSDWQTLPTFKQAEEKLLREAMHRANDNMSLAARLLGVSQSAISQRMKKLDK